MTDGNAFHGLLRYGIISLILMLSHVELQASPHLYYDDLGLIPWRTNWTTAQQEALLLGKVVLVQVTRYPCPNSKAFCAKSFPDQKLQKVLRRYCVCFVVDYHRLPADLKKFITTKGYGEDQCPIHLLLTPGKEVLNWAVQNTSPEVLAKMIEQSAADKRLQLNKAQEKEIEKLIPLLQAAITTKDTRKIQSTWQSIQKIPGFSAAKNKAHELLETAEETARKKLFEAAQLLREQKHPQAQLALDEAKAFAESLPIASEIDQSLANLKLYERALEAERLATTSKQKQQSVTLYQQLISKCPDNTVATLAYQKLRTFSLAK